MAYITWTKTWSAADDGTILTGAQLGALENDIATIVNGGIGNINIADTAAILEAKFSFNITTGHNHDGTNSRLVSATNVLPRGSRIGCELTNNSVTTLTGQGGSLDINGSIYSRTTDSTTIDITNLNHYISGVVEQGTNKWLYIYAYNDAGNTWDIKLSQTSPTYSGYTSGTSGPLIYRYVNSVCYRCIGAIRLNAVGAGEIIPFIQIGDTIFYTTSSLCQVLVAGGSVVWAEVACANYVPYAIARNVGIAIIPAAGFTGYLSIDAGVSTWLSFSGASQYELWSDIPLNVAGKFYYYVNGSSVSMNVRSYRLSIP